MNKFLQTLRPHHSYSPMETQDPHWMLIWAPAPFGVSLVQPEYETPDRFLEPLTVLFQCRLVRKFSLAQQIDPTYPLSNHLNEKG